MSTRAVIDVSELPHHEFDTYDPVWWGNNLLLAIETSMFAILIATYFYLRQNFVTWPPPHSESPPYLFEPVPRLLLPTINLAVIILSVLPMAWADAAARRRFRWRVGCVAPHPAVHRVRRPEANRPDPGIRPAATILSTRVGRLLRRLA